MWKKNKRVIIWFVIFPLLVGLACTCGLLPLGGDSPQTEEVEEGVLSVTEPVAVEIILVEEPKVEEVVTEEPTLEPTEEIQMEETEVVIIQPGEELIARELTWLQEDRDVFITFYLSNQYPDKNLESIQYWISLLDADGEEIRNEWSTFPWLFAQQTVGVAFRAYLPEDSPAVDSVTIEYEFKMESPADEFENPLVVDKLKSWDGSSKLVLTGIVNNSSATVFTNVRVNHICYDAQDQVVGGGYTFVDFVPGNNWMGFNTLADTYGEVVRVEAFPIITYNSKTFEDTPEFWQSISILDQAYNENRFGNLMGGFIIQNNLKTVMKGTVAIVTFTDAEGNITTYGSQKIPYLFPGSTLGLYPFIYSQPQGATSEDYKIIVLPGVPDEDYEPTENVFRVEGVTITGDANEYAVVSYTNTHEKPASEVDVYILAFDEDGVIIGGAKSNHKGPIPAKSVSETEIYIYYNRDFVIADVQAWVLPNTWTKFE